MLILVKSWFPSKRWLGNYYHDKFISQIRSDLNYKDWSSYQEIYDTIKQGAYVEIQKGFHSRNNFVAKSEYMLAFSWGQDEPNDGGTKYTWDKGIGKKYHINLNNL